MRLTKSVATFATGALLAIAALAAVATPAAAIDEGTLLDGGIYWFSTAGPLASQTPSTQITSGTGPARPWVTLTTQNACPAGTTQMFSYVRIPQVGVPENDWTQVAVGAKATLSDAGRFYTTLTSQADRMALKSEVQTYNAAHGGAGDFPFLAVCRNDTLASLGYFRTMVHIAGVDPMGADSSWAITSPTCSSATECTGTGGGTEAQATTTTLTAAASGADLVLTAAVTPAAAAGQVTFKDGGTTLGTAAVSSGTASYTVTAPAQGAHSFTADFAPTDTAAYLVSSGSLSVTLALDLATGQLVLTVPAAPTGTGSLTFAVPFDTPVQLVGTRSDDNTRVTATGTFPTVTVTDTRSDDLLTGWEVNAQASDFTGTAGTIGAKYLGWVPSTSATPDAGSPLVTQNGATVVSFLDNVASAGLSVSSTLGRAATPGRGTATLGAPLNLAIPGSTPEGSYTSTVTVTLVSD